MQQIYRKFVFSPVLALAGLSLSTLLSSLATSSVNIALPTLQQAFQASFSEVQWVVLAYLLAITALVVIAGRVGDVLGRRQVLLGGIAVFAAASALCAMAPTLPLLLIARGVQGMGAAVMMSLTLALANEAVAKERAGSVMGLLATMSAIGTALGPSCGGMLIASFGWPALFLASVPLAMLAFVLVFLGLPRGPRRPAGSARGIDGRGGAALAVALVAYTLAMTIGWSDPGFLTLAFLAAAGLGLWVFVQVQERTASPLVDLALLGRSRLLSRLAMGMLVSTVMMASLVVGPFYLSVSLGLPAIAAGLVLSVGPLTVALAGVPAGRLVDRFGAFRMTMAGLAIMTIGCGLLALMPATAELEGYVAAIALVTAGYAVFLTANNTAAMKDIGVDSRGVVSGMLNLSRNLGLVTGASAMGSVFAAFVGSQDVADASAAAVSVGMRAVFAVAAGLTVVALALGARGRRT